MTVSILQVVATNDGNLASLQRQLVDLCGVDMITEIKDIVEHKDELLASYEVS